MCALPASNGPRSQRPTAISLSGPGPFHRHADLPYRTADDRAAADAFFRGRPAAWRRLRWIVPGPLDSPRLKSGPVGARWSHGIRVEELDPELLTWLREARVGRQG